jgi:hypothetical protein
MINAAENVNSEDLRLLAYLRLPSFCSWECSAGWSRRLSSSDSRGYVQIGRLSDTNPT